MIVPFSRFLILTCTKARRLPGVTWVYCVITYMLPSSRMAMPGRRSVDFMVGSLQGGPDGRSMRFQARTKGRMLATDPIRVGAAADRSPVRRGADRRETQALRRTGSPQGPRPVRRRTRHDRAVLPSAPRRRSATPRRGIARPVRPRLRRQDRRRSRAAGRATARSKDRRRDRTLPARDARPRGRDREAPATARRSAARSASRRRRTASSIAARCRRAQARPAGEGCRRRSSIDRRTADRSRSR